MPKDNLIEAIVNYDIIKLSHVLEELDPPEKSSDSETNCNICEKFWQDETTGLSPLLLSLHCRNFKATELLLSHTTLDLLIKNEKYYCVKDESGKECCITFLHMLIAKQRLELLKETFELRNCCTNEKDLTDFLNSRMICEIYVLKESTWLNKRLSVTCFEYALLKGRMDIVNEFFTQWNNYMQKTYVAMKDIKRLAHVVALSCRIDDNIFGKLFIHSQFSYTIIENPVDFLNFLLQAIENNNFNIVRKIFDEFVGKCSFIKDRYILYRLICPIFNGKDEGFIFSFLNNFIEKYLSSLLPHPLIDDDKIEQNILILAVKYGHYKIAHYILNVICYNLNICKSSLEKVLNSSLKHAANKRSMDLIKLLFAQMKNMRIDEKFWKAVITKQAKIKDGFDSFIEQVFQEFYNAEQTSNLNTNFKAILMITIENENMTALNVILKEYDVFRDSELLIESFNRACEIGSANVVHTLLKFMTKENKDKLKKNIQSFSDYVQQLITKQQYKYEERIILLEFNELLNLKLNIIEKKPSLIDIARKYYEKHKAKNVGNSKETIPLFFKLPAAIRLALTRMQLLTDNLFEEKDIFNLDDKIFAYLNSILIAQQTSSSDKNKNRITTPLHEITKSLDKNILVLMIQNKIDILAVDGNGDTVLHMLAKLSSTDRQNETEYINVAAIILHAYLNTILPKWENVNERRHVAFIILTRLIFNRQSMSVVSCAVFHKAIKFLKFLLEISVERLLEISLERLTKSIDVANSDFMSEIVEKLPAKIDVTGLCNETMPQELTNRKLYEVLSILAQSSNIRSEELYNTNMFVVDPPITTIQNFKINPNCSFVEILSHISYNKQEFIELFQIPVVRKLASQLNRDYRFTMIIVLNIHIVFMIFATLLATINKWPEGATTGRLYNGTQLSPDGCQQVNQTFWQFLFCLSLLAAYNITILILQIIFAAITLRKHEKMKKVLNCDSLEISYAKYISAIFTTFIFQTAPAVAWLVLRLYCQNQQPYVVAFYLCVGWIFTIFYMKSFKRLHIFTSALFSVGKNICFFFMAIVFFFPLGFGSALLVMFSFPPAIYNTTDMTTQIAYLATKLTLNLGGFFDPPVTAPNGDFSRIIFIQFLYTTSVIITSVFTLNIIISMMSEQYEKARTNQRTQWHIRSLRRAQHMRCAFWYIVKYISFLRKFLHRCWSIIKNAFVCKYNEKINIIDFEIDSYNFCPEIKFFKINVKNKTELSSS